MGGRPSVHAHTITKKLNVITTGQDITLKDYAALAREKGHRHGAHAAELFDLTATTLQVEQARDRGSHDEIAVSPSR